MLSCPLQRKHGGDNLVIHALSRVAQNITVCAHPGHPLTCSFPRVFLQACACLHAVIFWATPDSAWITTLTHCSSSAKGTGTGFGRRSRILSHSCDLPFPALYCVLLSMPMAIHFPAAPPHQFSGGTIIRIRHTV